MKVVTGYPPNFKEIAKRFAVPPRAVFAWGSTIFNPSGRPVSGDIIVHETVHQGQQKRGGGPEAWWRRYLDEPEFLLAQESEAYARQFQYICSQNGNRNYQFQVLQALALMLAGPMYGFPCSQERAMSMIRSDSSD